MTRSSEEPTRIPLPGNQNVQDWSPDEQYILYWQGPAIDLMAMSLADGKSFAVVQSGFASPNAQFSPNGQWITFQSDESGQNEIYVVRFPMPGRRHPVTARGGVQPRWSHDLKELFYLAPDDTLMRVPIERLDTATATVKAGKPVSLFTLPLGGSPQAGFRRHYDVSEDGRFLVDTALEVTLPITVLLNWRPAP
jgi:Tol biopolymer transport system component